MSIALLRPARVNPVVRHPQEERLSLDGEWRFHLEPEPKPGQTPSAIVPRFKGLREKIKVPGCWQGQDFGGEGKDRLWDFALEARVFRATSKGTGWYGRTFTVPDAWNGQRLWLNFGGAHPSAEVWLNGTCLGENDLPFVPFAFDVTDAVKRHGPNELLVRVHEKHREFGLAFSWQGNWSGLYRSVELTATGPCWFERCAVLPNADSAKLVLRLAVGGDVSADPGLTLAVNVVPVCIPKVAGAARSRQPNRTGPATLSAEFTLPMPESGPKVAGAARPALMSRTGPATLNAEFTLPMPDPLLWSPEQPHLYRVDLTLRRGMEICDVRSERTGFVKLEARGKQFCINGAPYYLRGSGDFLSCPETGCPDTDRDRWRRKLQTLRDYGYNYVRCQSYVYGPEYYDAADEVGVLIQSEMGMLGGWGGSSCWHVYQWPKPTADNYPVLKAQWDLVVERDACHPSANLYCMSNELGKNTDFPQIAWECYHATKALKPTAQVIWTDGGCNPDLPGDFVNQFVDRFVGGGMKAEEQAKIDKPFIQHEYMWWSSFPDVRLRRRYRGAVRPYATEIAMAAAARHGQTHLLETYAAVSQRLQLLEAKAKMELMRRDFPHLAGICHFNAMDANPSPQGIITEFYERKIADSAQWRETNGDTVVLSSFGFDDRCRVAGETLEVRLFVSDFTHPSFRQPRLTWRLTANGESLATGTLEYTHESFQTCSASVLTLTVPSVKQVSRATLEAILQEGEREIRNRWDLWLFPAAAAVQPTGVAVYGQASRTWLKEWKSLPFLTAAELLTAGAETKVVLTEKLDSALVAFMQAGGRVILAPGEGLVRPHHALFGYVKYFFTPPANYAPYEDGQNGTVIQAHPLLGDLPHEGFADWQLFRLIENAPPLDLEPLGLADSDPVIRVIHRYPVLHPLGYLVERRCGRGGLILCALDLRPEFAEARHLLAHFCRYAASAMFQPALELTDATLERLLAVGRLG